MLLALVLLALLVLLVTTMTYVGRIEARATDATARRVEARLSALAGSSMAIKMLAAQRGEPVAPNQAWARQGEIERLLTEPVDGQGAPAAEMTGARRLARLEIEDLAGRVNINALMPPRREQDADGADWAARRLDSEAFTRFLRGRLTAAGQDPALAAPIVAQLMTLRYGPDARPAAEPESERREVQRVGWQDRDALHREDTKVAPAYARRLKADYQSDPRSAPVHYDEQETLRDIARRAAAGKDRPLDRLERLLALPGMTPSAWLAVEPYLTTWSTSPEIWRDPNERRYYMRTPLAQVPDAEALMATLQTAYPGARPEDLAPYAAHLADRLDADRRPSLIEDRDGNILALGFELGPVISEVAPDVMSTQDEGDNGEYIELYNPTEEWIDLAGWTLEWGSGLYRLTQQLPPRGFLIVTDDIKDDNDETPETGMQGMGSFFAVFGTMGFTTRRQMAEQLGLELPNVRGQVRLRDDSGALIDYLDYDNALFDGLNRGFSKPDRLGHRGLPGPATPFAATLETELESPGAERWERFLTDRDRPAQNLVELLDIPTAEPQPLDEEALQSVWRFPSWAVSGGKGPDLALLDCFTLEHLAGASPDGRPQRWQARAEDEEVPGSPELDALQPLATRQAGQALRGPVSFGKINLNTAPLELLAALPGLNDARLLERIDRERRALGGFAGLPTADSDARLPAPFSSLGDFAANPFLWKDMELDERAEILTNLLPLVTVYSDSFLVRGVNRVEPDDPRADTPSLVAWEARVNLSREGADVLDWRLTPWNAAPLHRRALEGKAPEAAKTGPDKPANGPKVRLADAN